jgi:(1->4)-alpha-D-glucan 1-alpha-D-glucosylmutase
MQTTGPVTAKGVEDRAFYRYTRLSSLTEVGGDPSRFALDVPGFHAAFARRQASWPHALTALTTHDTKRSEDVRARLAVLAEIPDRWAAALDALRAIASTGDGPLDALLWQAVVGAWSDDPALPERLHAYAEKAARESAVGTSWTDPDEAFEARVHGSSTPRSMPRGRRSRRSSPTIVDAGRSNSLSAKLLQLAGPGVPDVYQGTELWDLSLVDPDNPPRRLRRPPRAARTARRRMDAVGRRHRRRQAPPRVADAAAAPRRPDLFTRYTPLPVVGAASAHAVAFDRGGAIAVATRLPVGSPRAAAGATPR